MKRIFTARVASLLLVLITAVIMALPASAADRTLAYKRSYSDNSVTLYVTKYNDADTLYYTLNGTTPTASSKILTDSGITVTKKTQVNVIELDKSRKKVAVLNVALMPRAPLPSVTVISKNGKKYLQLKSSIKGAKIYYTTDGSDPDETSTRYRRKFLYTPGTTVKMRVYAKNYADGHIREYYEEDDTSDSNVSEEAKAVFDIVNTERKAKGLYTYKLNAKLCELADIRAKELATQYSHTRPDGTQGYDIIKENGLVYSARSENIARKQDTPEWVMSSWMKSPNHRAAILSTKYDYIGVGHYEEDGVHYWVQLFAKK